MLVEHLIHCKIEQPTRAQIREENTDTRSSSKDRCKLASLIDQQLFANPMYFIDCSNENFGNMGHGKSACHLKALEVLHYALQIASNKQLNFCAQKMFVYNQVLL